MINLTFPYPTFPCYASPEDAALYFNSMSQAYDYQYMEPVPVYYQPFQYASYPQYTPFCKTDPEAERSTADCEDFDEEVAKTDRSEVKQQETQRSEEEFIPVEKNVQKKVEKKIKDKNAKIKKEKNVINLRKNTESNLINNIFSYVCSEMKSHKAVKKLLKTTERKKIFYIFMNNLKKLNNKYLNRKNVKALLDLEPDQPHEKTLSKSVKRLIILPIHELKIVLRQLVYDYLRNSMSLLPILTSKKICRVALKEHLEKRRELMEYFFKKSEKI